jgi:hypothetical protein
MSTIGIKWSYLSPTKLGKCICALEDAMRIIDSTIIIKNDSPIITSYLHKKGFRKVKIYYASDIVTNKYNYEMVRFDTESELDAHMMVECSEIVEL